MPFLRFELLITVAFLLFEIMQTTQLHVYDEASARVRDVAREAGHRMTDTYVSFAIPQDIGTPTDPINTSATLKANQNSQICYGSNSLGTGPGVYYRIRTGAGKSHTRTVAEMDQVNAY